MKNFLNIQATISFPRMTVVYEVNKNQFGGGGGLEGILDILSGLPSQQNNDKLHF
jgi:hypothetical protein